MPALPEDLERLLHDLRGPLNSAVMHLEVVKRVSPGDPAGQQSLETIQRELGRLAALLPAAFTVIALEPGEVGRHGLRALVERVVAEQGLGPVTIGDGSWPDVVGDARLLELAIAHLVRNALAATAAAGAGRRPPEVTASTSGRHVTLVVRDWGTGLRSTNPKVMIRLAPGGAGGRAALGLVTVERIARLHRGTLRFETPGEGARVSLTLPTADASADAPRS